MRIPAKSGLGRRLLALAGCLVLVPLCPAQALVRGSSGEIRTANDPDLVSPSAVAPDGQPSDAETERLIRQYAQEAGPVGPRKLFSGTRFDVMVSVGVAYDDNILLSSTGPRHSDIVTSLSGGARLSFGDFAERVNTYLVLGYTGTGYLFAKHDAENCYDQDALLDVLYRPHEYAFGSTSVFQERHDATADLGQRVGREMYGEDLTVKDYRNDITTLSGDLHYDDTNYDTGIDTSNLELTLAVDYSLLGRVTVGAGAVFGRLTATGGVTEYSEQAQVRLDYTVTHKIVVTSSFGLEYRQRGGEAGDTLTPVFELAGKWTPFTGTTFEVEGHRRTEASGALDGEDFLDTGFQLGVRQDLLKRFYVRLDVGFQNADYDNVTNGESTPSRNDNYFTIRGTVGYDFVQWLQLLAFYEHREDDSTQASFTFVSNRVGMELSLIY